MNQINPYADPSAQPGQAMVSSLQGNAPDFYRHNGSAYPNYPTYGTMPEVESGVDFYKYLRIASKYKWLIAGIVLTSLLVAALITFLMTPVYRATATLQIDREAMSIVKVGGVQPEEAAQDGAEFYQTQYALLASRSLAERVTTTLGLTSDPTFVVKQTSITSVLKDVLGGTKKDDTSQEITQEELSRKTVDFLSKSLKITPLRGSRIVEVSIDHASPGLAQRIANGYAEVFIADNLDRRFDASSYARKFLEERLQQLKLRLEESEKQLVKYAEDQGIIRLNDNQNLSSVDLEAINVKLAEAHNERVKKELLWKQAQTVEGLGLKEILDSDAIKANRKLRTELSAEYQQKLAIFKPAFPAMEQLRNQIKELDRQVQNEVESIKQSIEAEYLASQQQEEELQGQLDKTKVDVVDQRNRSIQYNIIQREVDTNRTLYDGLLQRYKEIGVAGGVGTNNVSIVDRAAMPLLPRVPNIPLNMMLALIGGLVLGVLTAIGLDHLDDSFKSPEDIERELGLTVVGVVPRPKSVAAIEEELLDPRSAMAEAYRSLRTGLQFATSDGLPRTLLVTSSKPSEGKTTTTIAMAKAFAHIGLQVLLIDGDLRNASVHKRLRCNNTLGLSNYLSGSKLPEDVVQATDTDGLIVMSSGPLPPNPAELLTGPRLASLLALASQSFDIVLVDGPPVMGLADAPLLSSAIQTTLLVVAANETRRSIVKIALKRLQFARANIVGAILNKFDSKQVGYGYGYGYGEYDYHSYGKDLQLPSSSS